MPVKRFLCDMQSMLMQYADMSEIHHRLRQARIQSGYKSAAEAARRLAMPYGTYSGHENGNRGFKKDDFIKYARVFNVSVEWLIEGKGNPDPSDTLDSLFVYKIGSVGDLPNGELNVSPADNRQHVVRMTYFPEDTNVVQITGSSAKNFVRAGWYLLCEDLFYELEGRHEGELCLCKFHDGRIFLMRIIRINENGSCDLEDANGDIIFQSKILGVSVVGLILPNVAVKGMAEFARLHADNLLKMAEQMRESGQQSMGYAVDLTEHQFRWGRSASSRAVGV